MPPGITRCTAPVLALLLCGCQTPAPRPPGGTAPAARPLKIATPGGSVERFAVKGQLIRLEGPGGLEGLPYRYHGEPRVEISRRGRLVKRGGKVIGVDISGLKEAAALALLKANLETELVIWRGVDRPAPAIVSVLAELAARRLTLWYGQSLTARGPLDPRPLQPIASRLDALVLEGEISADTLRALAGFRRLRSLRIEGPLGHSALRALALLTRLTSLDLRAALSTFGAPAHALSGLGRLTGLVTLDLGENLLNDRHLDNLATLTRLHWLNLSGNPLTGERLGQLASLDQLIWLGLSGTGITDKVVARLAAMKSLRWVVATGTSISARGVAALKRALPDCELVPGSREGATGPAASLTGAGAISGSDRPRPVTRGRLVLPRPRIVGIAACDRYLALLRCFLSQVGGRTRSKQLYRQVFQNLYKHLGQLTRSGRKRARQSCQRALKSLHRAAGSNPRWSRCLNKP